MGQEYTFDQLIEAAGDRFNPIPEGTYIFNVTAAEPTVSKKSGNAMLAVTLKVAGGPESGKSPKTVYISKPGPGTKPERLESASRMFLRHLSAFGIKAATLREHSPTMAQLAAVMTGASVKGDIKHEEFRGETQSVVSGSLRKAHDEVDEVREFPLSAATDEYSIRQELTGPAPIGSVDDPGF